MEIDDPEIVALREKVTAAQQEFDMAVTFHEVWKPATYDQDLHSRMGEILCFPGFPRHEDCSPARDGARAKPCGDIPPHLPGGAIFSYVS